MNRESVFDATVNCKPVSSCQPASKAEMNLGVRLSTSMNL